MKGETQVTDILSLGNQKVYLSESVTRQGYFYKIRRSQSKKQLPVHYLFMIDVSKPMNAYRIEIQKALEWAFKYLSKQSSHQISIIVFYGKKNIKWIFKEVNSHELISLIGDINSFLDEELTPYSNSSLINTLESVMSQLDSRFYNHLIVISSGSFQLIDYELDLKQARFQKVTSLFNELSMKLDVLNLGELISSNFYQWVSILNQKAHVYSCFKKMELKFYLNKILRGQRVNLLIDSNDFFLCQKKDFVRKENPIEIEVLDEELIVVFDKPLKIEQKVLDYSTQVLSQDFDYFVTQYCLYLLENQLIQQVSNILSHYGQLGWVKDMSEAYTSSEIIQVMKSFANHRKLKKENSLCLLTLLELIRQDQQSVLLWNRYEDYVPILFRTKVIDSQFQFQEIETDFYVVNQLVLGSRKFNVGLKVKVEGHVEELKTGLKLEAYRFKTYTILLDGVLKIKELYCVLSPSENAQKYFQKYNKAKNSVNYILEQIELTEKEISYFETLLIQIETASLKDAYEIKEELENAGYLRKRQTKKRKTNNKPSIEKYLSDDQIEIYVGKNNLQNDYLTHKLARRYEWWFHAKDMPGSHVLVRSDEDELSETTIRTAAQLAAYFSKGRISSSVPVDYTRIRHVKKIPAAHLGLVTYENQKTIYIDPEESFIMSLTKLK